MSFLSIFQDSVFRIHKETFDVSSIRFKISGKKTRGYIKQAGQMLIIVEKWELVNGSFFYYFSTFDIFTTFHNKFVKNLILKLHNKYTGLKMKKHCGGPDTRCL